MKSCLAILTKTPAGSRPARGAWIEMTILDKISIDPVVAPRAGRGGEEAID